MKNIEIDPGEMARKSRDFLREHAAGFGNPLERTAVSFQFYSRSSLLPSRCYPLRQLLLSIL
jgi:histidine ammonia-lyase